MARRYSDDPKNLDRGFRDEKPGERPEPKEREKKSWKERDAQRDRSSHRRDDRAQGPRKSKAESQAYQAYKSSLDAVFDGGDVPDSLKEKLEAAGIGQDKKARKAAAKAIVDASKASERLAALQAYREAHGFPVEEEVLATLLDLDDEPEVVHEALQAIEGVLDEGGLKRAGSLKARIQTAKMTVDDDDVFAAATRLLKKL